MDMFLFDLDGDGTVDMGVVDGSDFTAWLRGKIIGDPVDGAFGAQEDLQKGDIDGASDGWILVFEEADAFHFVETTAAEFAKLAKAAAITFPDYYDGAAGDGIIITFPDYYDGAAGDGVSITFPDYYDSKSAGLDGIQYVFDDGPNEPMDDYLHAFAEHFDFG